MHLFLGDLVTFRKHETKWQSPDTELIDKLHIDRLWCMSTIDEDEDLTNSGPTGEIVCDHLCSLITLLFRDLGIAVARQIYQISAHRSCFVVDTFYGEIVDELGLTWMDTRLGQGFFATYRIDQARFADITPADEGVLRSVSDRCSRMGGSTHHEGRGNDTHRKEK